MDSTNDFIGILFWLCLIFLVSLLIVYPVLDRIWLLILFIKDTMPRPFRRKTPRFGGRASIGNLQNIGFVKKGLVYIFSHDEFPGYERRPGREIDEQRIRDHFSQRNFEVVDPFVNLTADGVSTTLEKVASTNFENYDCILVFVISQYDNIGKYLAKTGSYTEDEITQWFKGSTTPFLVVKPKLFFFQASKATPVPKQHTFRKSSIAFDGGKDEPSFYSLPVEANLFIVRSSLNYITDDGGTWFINEVCLHLNGRMPLHDEIVNVSSSAKEKIDGDFRSLIPDVTSTLTNKLYLGDTENNANQSLEAYERGEKNGCVLIFNYDEVYNVKKTEFESRDGTENDWKKMEATFLRLDFDVFVEHNLRKRDVTQKINDRKDLFSSYACIIVAVFTHGYNGMLGTADGDLDPTALFEAVDEFEGKPKIFIFQVCRGDELSEGVLVQGSVENEIPEIDEEDDLETEGNSTAVDALHDSTKNNPVLQMDDTLVLHSAFSGSAAVRSKVKGTWLIQELCAEINRQTPNMTTASLLDIFIRVQQTVALKQYVDKKQMPVYTSTLTRKLVIGKRYQAV